MHTDQGSKKNIFQVSDIISRNPLHVIASKNKKVKMKVCTLKLSFEVPKIEKLVLLYFWILKTYKTLNLNIFLQPLFSHTVGISLVIFWHKIPRIKHRSWDFVDRQFLQNLTCFIIYVHFLQCCCLRRGSSRTNLQVVVLFLNVPLKFLRTDLVC